MKSQKAVLELDFSHQAFEDANKLVSALGLGNKSSLIHQAVITMKFLREQVDAGKNIVLLSVKNDKIKDTGAFFLNYRDKKSRNAPEMGSDKPVHRVPMPIDHKDLNLIEQLSELGGFQNKSAFITRGLQIMNFFEKQKRSGYEPCVEHRDGSVSIIDFAYLRNVEPYKKPGILNTLRDTLNFSGAKPADIRPD